MTTFESAVSTAFIHDTIVELAAFKTQFDVFRLMKRITEACGSRAFMVLTIPSATSLDLSSNSIITNWPADLLSSYDKVALLAESPIVQKLRAATTPFAYNVSVGIHERSDRTESPARALFERFNLPRGAYFPVHDVSGNRGAVSFPGDDAAELSLQPCL
jgi:LuxR family quorum sensing-dependent transcriptional regulator